MASASDVPYKFDVVINSQGYVFADSEQQKAVLGYSPPFISRQNTQGNYGDNQQDFWLSFSQKDWSKGERLKYARPGDEDSAGRYWQGTNIDVSTAGQVSLRPLTNQTSAFGSAVTELARGTSASGNAIYASGTTNLYSIVSGGTITDHGAHGLGTAPSAIVAGGRAGVDVSGAGLAGVYLSSILGGSVGVREWDSSSYTTFSATASDSLAFLNNTLYGVTSSALLRYDTAGAATALYTWRAADGTVTPSTMKVAPFGGKLLILRSQTDHESELYLYDGTAPAKIAEFTHSFIGLNLAVVGGTVFVGGYLTKRLSSATYRRPSIFFYANGSTGKLWESPSFVVSTSTREPRLTGFQGGLVFTDDTRGQFMFYDTDLGGVSSIGAYTFTDVEPRLAATGEFFLHSRAATQPWRHPADGWSTSGTVTTALIDYDSSLTKLFRGIKVEWDDDPSDTGATVDIAYRVGDVDGSYTTLQTGAVSGTEYLLTNITGRSISVKVTLNKTNSTAGPTLKRISIRAAPIQPGPGAGVGFKKRTYVLNCTGRDGEMPVKLRDGSLHAKDGKDMATDLQTAATSTTPFTIVDSLGSFTGIIENLELLQIRPEEFIAKVSVREV